MDSALVSAYRWHRAALAAGKAPPPLRNSFRMHDAYQAAHAKANAFMCLRHARADVAAGTARHWSRPFNDRRNGFWKAGGSERMQWIERPADIGLRFVGYADEIDVQHTKHTGWFVDDDGVRGTLRGVVYQLPSRAGSLQFVVGYEESEGRGTAIDFGTVHRLAAERDQWATRPVEHYLVARIARAADKLAEGEADEQRDYNRAYDAGVVYRQLGEEIAEAKADAKPALIALVASGCEAVREAAEEFVDSIRELIDARRELASGDYDGPRGYLGFWSGDPDLRSAFNDGAEKAVLA